MSMTINPDDELTRFIRPKQRKYVRDDLGIKTQAFSIGKEDNSVSVFVTTGMNSHEVWRHGDDYYPHEVVGRALLNAEVPISEGLAVILDEPPPKHANITGFTDSPDFNLSKKQALAMASKFEVKDI